MNPALEQHDGHTIGRTFEKTAAGDVYRVTCTTCATTIEEKPAPPSINIGELDKTKYTIHGRLIAFVKLMHDDDPQNPCEEFDGVGQIYSFNRRHNNFKDPDEAAEILKSDPDAVALSYYEHGLCRWSAVGNTVPGEEFRFDGVRFAGIWVPDTCVRESYTGQDGKTRREWMIDQAKSACEQYTQFCNGEVYGYDVKVYAVLFHEDDNKPLTDVDDYDDEEELAADSCFGMFGWDYVTSEAADTARRFLAELPQPPERVTMPSVTRSELATILAALRYYQKQGLTHPRMRPSPIDSIATDGGAVTSLDDDDAIDELCLKLNGDRAA